MTLIAQLQQCLGADQVLTSPEAQASYLKDWRGRYQGRAQAVVLPTTAQAVADVVRFCMSAGVPIVPLGFNGSYEVLAKGTFLPRSGEITIRVGPPLATGHYKSADKQALAGELHAAVEKLLEERYLPR